MDYLFSQDFDTVCMQKFLPGKEKLMISRKIISSVFGIILIFLSPVLLFSGGMNVPIFVFITLGVSQI